MYCENCGSIIENKTSFCTNCGKAVVRPKASCPSWIVILLLILIFPVGLLVMWRKTKWSDAVKCIITAIICISVLVFLGSFAGDETKNGVNSTTQNQQITLSPQQIEQEYKESCQESDYETLARNPDNFKGQKFKLTGEVIQVLEKSYQTELRINITPDTFGDATYYSDTIYAILYPEEGADRILEGDVLTIWCECTGLMSYISVLGQKISMPGFTISYYELVQ